MRAERIVDVARENGRGQAVVHVVRDFERFVERLERNQRNHGAENFLLADSHRGIAIGKNGRLVEPAVGMSAIREAVAAGRELCMFGHADFHVIHHGLELLLVDARPHFNGGIEAVAHFKGLGARDKFLQKFPIDLFLNGDAAGCGAALAGGAEASPDRAFDGEVRDSRRPSR